MYIFLQIIVKSPYAYLCELQEFSLRQSHKFIIMKNTYNEQNNILSSQVAQLRIM